MTPVRFIFTLRDERAAKMPITTAPAVLSSAFDSWQPDPSEILLRCQRLSFAE
jgi:hypothetical protein